MYSAKVKTLAVVAFLCIFLALQIAPRFVGQLFFGRGVVPLIAIVLILCAGIVMAVVTWRSARTERKADQESRDRLAQQVAEEAERRLISEILFGGKTSPFVLYLRPFALEKAFREWKRETWLFKMLLFSAGKVNFDFLLQTYLNGLKIVLISIGAPNDKEGAGHVVGTDTTWRERFRQLAERATTIVVVPGIQAGILSEIRWLRVSGLLVNAVFFKPRGYPREAWEKMKQFYENEEDVELPDYSPKQLSFRMYSSGRCHDVLTWNSVYLRSKKRRGENQMRALLTNKPMDSD